MGPVPNGAVEEADIAEGEDDDVEAITAMAIAASFSAIATAFAETAEA